MVSTYSRWLAALAGEGPALRFFELPDIPGLERKLTSAEHRRSPG